MIKQIFYKEWLKTRWFLLASLVLGVATVLYIFIGLNSDIINNNGGSEYAYNLARRHVRDYALAFRNIPLIVALLVGVSQYIPEVLSRRIKLTLHLPRKETPMLYTMVLYGFLVILALMLLFMALFFSLDAYFTTAEMHANALNLFILWIMKGLTTYFFVAMIAMEPRWLYRFFYAIFVWYTLDLFSYENNVSRMYPLWIAIIAVASMSMIYTANRFKIGEN